jgi:DNA-binding MarR family transcriptional regulator
VVRYYLKRRVNPADLDSSEYHQLEEFRFQIRRFLSFSETAAGESGIEPQQHQALLVLKGMPAGRLPTIGHLADRLLLRHHSAVGLVDRLQSLGLVTRESSPGDARQVLVQLTTKGKHILHRLSLVHRQELEETGPKLAAVLRAISRKTNS